MKKPHAEPCRLNDLISSFNNERFLFFIQLELAMLSVTEVAVCMSLSGCYKPGEIKREFRVISRTGRLCSLQVIANEQL